MNSDRVELFSYGLFLLRNTRNDHITTSHETPTFEDEASCNHMKVLPSLLEPACARVGFSPDPTPTNRLMMK